jgi:hypothetical protein
MAPAAKEIIKTIKVEAQYAEIAFDRIAGWHSGWWHRPFTEAEIDAHPDGERIRATLEAAVRDTIECACDMASYQLDEAAP